METYYIFANVRDKKEVVFLGKYQGSWSGECVDQAHNDAVSQNIPVLNRWYVRVTDITPYLLTEGEERAIESGSVIE